MILNDKSEESNHRNCTRGKSSLSVLHTSPKGLYSKANLLKAFPNLNPSNGSPLPS